MLHIKRQVDFKGKIDDVYLLCKQSAFSRSLHFSWHLTPHSVHRTPCRAIPQRRPSHSQQQVGDVAVQVTNLCGVVEEIGQIIACSVFLYTCIFCGCSSVAQSSQKSAYGKFVARGVLDGLYLQGSFQRLRLCYSLTESIVPSEVTRNV